MQHVLGAITQLQVQRDALKVGERPTRHYDPTPLVRVGAIRIDGDGVVGLVDGEAILDVHNRNHPASRHKGINAVSVGFTAHYALMRSRFGPHVEVGCAGENIVVEVDRDVGSAIVARGLRVLAPDGREKCVLPQAEVAHPCREFSTYVLRDTAPPAETLKETLQFLDGGMRGYYCALRDGSAEVEVAIGDLVAFVENPS